MRVVDCTILRLFDMFMYYLGLRENIIINIVSS